jgi:hypothetical protein
MKKNELDLRFMHLDFNGITHEEITEILGISSTKVLVKGQKKNQTDLIVRY